METILRTYHTSKKIEDSNLSIKLVSENNKENTQTTKIVIFFHNSKTNILYPQYNILS